MRTGPHRFNVAEGASCEGLSLDYDFLLPEMLDFAQAHLRNLERNLLFIPTYDYDKPFLAVA